MDIELKRDAVVLKGGLGNQLFQWSFALSLIRRGRSVFLDDSMVSSGVGYQLEGLKPEIASTKRPSLGRSLSNRAHLPLTLSGYRIAKEKSFAFNARVADNLRGRVLFDGYWQSEEYFLDIADEVRDAVLSFGETSLTAHGQALLKEIQSGGPTVSLHLRRGDYVTNPLAAKFHGALPMSYYDDALDVFSDDPTTRVLIFSDDLEFAGQAFRGPQFRVVDRLMSKTAAGDLRLMSACRGHITANSSFSWWGAWCDPNKDAVVVSPKRWFASGSLDTSDLQPAHWVLL